VNQRPLVIKFGGTSVGDGAAFLRAAEIAAGAAKDRPVAVVVSAMSGTTDALLGFAAATARTTGDEPSRTSSTGATREGSLTELHRSLARRHLRAAREAVPKEFLADIEERLHEILGCLIQTADAPANDYAARKDAVVSFGERLSAEILAGAISGFGAPATVVAADPIATDASFGEAEVLVDETWSRAGEYVRPLLEAGRVAVAPGYVGRGPGGVVTTLGRGGSDLSATVLGRALGSSEVWILSDVDGVLDADPDLIPSAALIPGLSYREAGQFASLGAKVLHPRTMEPASAARMEVRVGSTFNPDSPGTLISGREGGPGVRSVALRRNLAMTHATRDEAKHAFCILGSDADGLKVLADGATTAAVVGVGTPTDEDLLLGLRCLHNAGIRTLWAGNTCAGLVFAVNEGEAEAALRTVYAGLIPVEAAADMEEVA